MTAFPVSAHDRTVKLRRCRPDQQLPDDWGSPAAELIAAEVRHRWSVVPVPEFYVIDG